MKKKSLFLGIITLAVIITFASCGDDDGSTTTAPTSTSTSTPTPLPQPIPIEMVQIPAVTGWSAVGSSGQATLSAFKMGKYEVTQAQWQSVMGNNPSNFKGDNLPVETINWYDILVFCNTLSMREGLTPAYRINGSTDPADWGAVPYWDNGTVIGNTTQWNAFQGVTDSNGYRLPSQVEWLYAAHSGLTTEYTATNDNAWYRENSNGTTHKVGQKEPNGFGLYDMLGNVMEWSGNLFIKPHTPELLCTVFGGSWDDLNPSSSSIGSVDIPPSIRDSNIGFRVVRP